MKKESTKKRIWLTALAAVSLGALFGSCKDEFDEVLGICPEVESTNPATDAIGVALNKTITVTFNEALNPASVVPGAFSLRVINTSGGIAEEIAGELTYQAETNSMNFKPSSDLSPNTTYTGRVEPVVKDMMGNALQAPYVWTFTTGVSPTVISTDPANLATGVALDKSINATFSMAMDSMSITATSFTLMNGTTPVTGVISYAGNTASFKPSVDLLAGTTYKGTISTEVKNKDGIPLAVAYNWTFNTGTAPTVIAIDPKDLAIAVPANKAIKVTFSELMNAATINASTFTVKIGNVPVAGTVTYSESSAVFTPMISLLSNTTYSVTVSNLVKNPVGISMANDFVSTFTTGNFAIPKVASTDPINNATGVAINKVIKATFSEAMNPATISGATFTIKQGTINVPGTVTYSGTTATFTPTNPLSSNLVYTGTITTDAKNTAGTAMANNFVWTFTTAAIVAPTVSSTDPGNNATNVALNKAVKATFSEAMNPATISGATFTIKQGTTNVAGTVTYSGTTATFTPTNPLSPSLVYTGTITTGAKNAAGTGLANNFVWTFTTAALNVPTVNSTDPANNAKDVAMNKVIKAVFNEAMNPATITGTTFTVKQGNTAVAGTVTYAGTTATFTPTNPLSPSLVYTGTITTGAKNAAGTGIASNYVWSFTTVASISPMVVSTDPAKDATGVPINKLIRATFSTAMNPATITGTTFTVKQGANAVSGIVSYSGTTATFTPNNPLAANLVYTATITIGAKNVDGTPLTSNYVWNFTTAANVAPTVVSTDPANNATNVALNKVVNATFSEAMNPATITGATFTVKQGQTVIAGTVTYNGTTASFTPSNPLSGGLVYTGTITGEAKNAAGTGLANNYVWNFTTVPNVAPTVVSTDPANNATNVALNKVVKANFSEAMNPATITGATFTVKQGQTPVAGTVTYSGTTASFTPSNPLSGGLVYTGTITGEAKNAAGTGLANNYVWNFTTVPNVAPTVVSTDPSNNATNVALNKVVNATFSEAMNPATITGATFTLKQGQTAVAGTVTYNGTTASFTPTNPLSGGLVYTGTITTDAKNAAGTGLANNYVWTFTTGAVVAPTVVSTDPANNATNVALNKVVNATFSESMNPATITGATFTLKQGQTAVAGTVTYNGTTASFTPTNPLTGGLVYTGTITTDAKNAAGTGLANNYVWTFTTAVPVAPTVLSTDPANNATNVALNKVVNATFSVAMNPATITGATFTLKQGQTAIAGNVTYNGTTASFTPNVPLLPGLVYTGTITTEAKNAAGTGLANNYVWSFTTVAPIAPTVLSTDPMNNATNVARNKVVRATFSIPMDATSINGNTFTLQLNGANVSGMVSYSGTTASFTPTTLLSANQVYTATITTGARSATGTNLVNDYVWSFRVENPISAYFVDLKSAGRFGIFAATGISNNAGFSVIRNLDVGITPGARSSVTGFPPAIVVNGAIFAADDASPAGVAAMLIQAKEDLRQAYLFAEGATSPAPATVAGDQGGKTLAPGIYKSNSTLLIQAGDLTLDAQGDPNAVWIFQIASGFTTVGGSGGNVILTGGAQAKNIFWQVGSSATIGDNTNFKGNVLAFTSITMNSGAKIVGRMLVLNGAVVMTNTNIIEKP